MGTRRMWGAVSLATWSCQRTCYCENDKTPFSLFWVAFKESLADGLWRLASHPLPLVTLWAHNFVSFVEMRGRHVCDLTSLHFHARCTLKKGHFCDECNELFSFLIGLWFHSSSPVSENTFFRYFSYFSYPLPPPFFFLFLKGEEKSVCLPFMLWANSVVLFYGLGLRATSALNTNPWTATLMRWAKGLQAGGSGLCCGEKLGKIHDQEH